MINAVDTEAFEAFHEKATNLTTEDYLLLGEAPDLSVGDLDLSDGYLGGYTDILGLTLSLVDLERRPLLRTLDLAALQAHMQRAISAWVLRDREGRPPMQEILPLATSRFLDSSVTEVTPEGAQLFNELDSWRKRLSIPRMSPELPYPGNPFEPPFITKTFEEYSTSIKPSDMGPQDATVETVRLVNSMLDAFKDASRREIKLNRSDYAKFERGKSRVSSAGYHLFYRSLIGRYEYTAEDYLAAIDPWVEVFGEVHPDDPQLRSDS